MKTDEKKTLPRGTGADYSGIHQQLRSSADARLRRGSKILYFIVSYLLISLGIALSNRCSLPIVPTDLFPPRELAQITHISYAKIKIAFDVICLATTGLLTFGFLLVRATVSRYRHRPCRFHHGKNGSGIRRPAGPAISSVETAGRASWLRGI